MPVDAMGLLQHWDVSRVLYTCGFVLAIALLIPWSRFTSIRFQSPIVFRSSRSNAWPAPIEPTRRIDAPPSIAREPMTWPAEPGFSYSTRDSNVYYVGSIRIRGTNNSQKEVRLEDAYLASGISGAEVTMGVEVPRRVPEGWGNEVIAIALINPIPPGATVDLVVDLRAGTEIGMVERDFMARWSRMTLVVKYDGAEYRKIYDPQTIAGVFQKEFHRVPPPPRVTKAGDENPYSL